MSDKVLAYVILGICVFFVLLVGAGLASDVYGSWMKVLNTCGGVK
jgi:hypothetical protein